MTLRRPKTATADSADIDGSQKIHKSFQNWQALDPGQGPARPNSNENVPRRHRGATLPRGRRTYRRYFLLIRISMNSL